MIRTTKIAVIGTLPVVCAKAGATGVASGTAAQKSKGTTLHQQNKAHKLKGASAAAAASALGTNDKGAPQ